MFFRFKIIADIFVLVVTAGRFGIINYDVLADTKKDCSEYFSKLDGRSEY